VVLVAVSLALLAVTGTGAGSHSEYPLVGMIFFESGALALGLLFVFSHRLPRFAPSAACCWGRLRG